MICLLFYLTPIGAFSSEMKLVSLCAPQLMLSSLGHKQISPGMVDLFDKRFAVVGQNKNWIHIGTGPDSVFVNTDDLEVTDVSGYLESTGHMPSSEQYPIGDFIYRALVKSPSGQKIIITQGSSNLLSPLLIMDGKKLNTATHLTIERPLLAFDGIKGEFRFSPNENYLAYNNGASEKIEIFDVKGRSFLTTLKLPTPPVLFEWSNQKDNTLLIAEQGDYWLSVKRHMIDTNNQETIFEFKWNEPAQTAILKYSPQIAKLILTLSNTEEAKLIAVDENSGDGKSMNLPFEVNHLDVSTDGKMVAAINSISVSVHQIERLESWGETPAPTPHLSQIAFASFYGQSGLAILRWNGYLEIYKIRKIKKRLMTEETPKI